MTPIQIVLVVFFALAIIKVIARYRASEMSFSGAALWVVFWVAGGVVAVLPNSTATVAKFLGVGRGADVVVYAALALLFYIVFRLMVTIERLNRALTQVVREDALKKK